MRQVNSEKLNNPNHNTQYIKTDQTYCVWVSAMEWQFSGMAKSRITTRTYTIRLHDKITSNEIDDLISTEIPEENVDKGLYGILVKKMIHGPCGALDEKSPYMAKGRCTKQYPRLLVPNTITSNDGYPL